MHNYRREMYKCLFYFHIFTIQILITRAREKKWILIVHGLIVKNGYKNFSTQFDNHCCRRHSSSYVIPRAQSTEMSFYDVYTTWKIATFFILRKNLEHRHNFSYSILISSYVALSNMSGEEKIHDFSFRFLSIFKCKNTKKKIAERRNDEERYLWTLF